MMITSSTDMFMSMAKLWTTDLIFMKLGNFGSASAPLP